MKTISTNTNNSNYARVTCSRDASVPPPSPIRYFNIDNARRDLKYEPLVKFDDGWAHTISWFKENWLPDYIDKKGGKIKSK